MKTPKTCVIVVGGEAARLFDLTGQGNPLVPYDEHVLVAPAGNDHADAQGVTHSSVGHSQHRLAPHNGPDRNKEAFADSISARLTSLAERDAFQRLVLVASPEMLGILRDRLDATVQSRIWAQIDKNFAPMPVDKIGDAVKKHLFP